RPGILTLAVALAILWESKPDLLILVQTDFHLTSVHQTAEQELVGKRTTDRVLNEPLHWPSAHCRIEPFLGKVLAQCIGKGHFYTFLMQLVFELQQEFIHHAQDDITRQGGEADDGIETVAEFRCEHPLDLTHFISRRAGRSKADGIAVQSLRASVGR